MPASGYSDARSTSVLPCTILGVLSRWDLGLQCPPLRSPASRSPARRCLCPRSRQLFDPRGVRVPAPRAPAGRLAPHRGSGLSAARRVRAAGQVWGCTTASGGMGGAWEARGWMLLHASPHPTQGALKFWGHFWGVVLSPCGLGPFSHSGVQQGLKMVRCVAHSRLSIVQGCPRPSPCVALPMGLPVRAHSASSLFPVSNTGCCELLLLLQ